jgi:tRNA(Ile)-lysidine synthase
VLEEVARRTGAAAVLLGHTLDDQAETVLLGLTRGSGGRSLAGMRRGFDAFRRPLLGVTRAETEAACRAEGIEWWEDPHNRDPRFTRARVRHHVLPMLERELGPGVARALARTADLLREDSEGLDEIAGAVAGEVAEDGAVRCSALAAHPAAVRHRVLRLAATAAGCPPAEHYRLHVVELAGLAAGPEGPVRHKQVQLPGHVSAVRDGDWLRFRPTAVPG